MHAFPVGPGPHFVPQRKASCLPFLLPVIRTRQHTCPLNLFTWGMGAFLPPLNSFIPENWSAFSLLPGYHGAPGGAPSGTLSFFLDPIPRAG